MQDASVQSIPQMSQPSVAPSSYVAAAPAAPVAAPQVAPAQLVDCNSESLICNPNPILGPQSRPKTPPFALSTCTPNFTSKKRRKSAKIEEFDLPNPSPNPPQTPPKSRFQKTCDFSSLLLRCFSCKLEQCKPVKYSKNAVGSFKNTMYRKSEKINPRSDFS